MRRLLPAAALVTALMMAMAAQASAKTSMSVFATGFNNPRGLEFGPGGNLYVAEGGLGGSDSTAGQCDQVVPPVGPYTGSTNDPVLGGRISKVSRSGVVSTVVAGLPSSQASAALGGVVSGVGDVAFIGHRLYAVLAGAGCSHGVATVPNSVIRVRSDGTWSIVADLSAFLKAHPVAHPEPDDFEPDGTWYSLVSVGGALYAVEPNHGEVDRITRGGKVSRVVDVSASQGHVVPTAIVRHRGGFELGNLGTFAPTDGAGDEHVFRFGRSGELSVRASGVEKVLGVAYRGGKLYVLEMSTMGGEPVPGTGALVRVLGDGSLETIVSGLTFPTGLTVGPDTAFYVSERGFGFGPGGGQVLRIALSG